MKNYIGVEYNSITNKYHSKVKSGGLTYHCGMHDTPEEAARARDMKILEKGLGLKLQILKPAE